MNKGAKRYFATGLLIVLPVLITVYLFISLFSFFDNILGRYISLWTVPYYGHRIPGLGLLVFIVLIFLAGFFGTNYLGRKFFLYLERLWIKFPLVRSIYTTAKQVTRLIFSSRADGEGGFRSVVLVEFPHKGSYSLGFVTNQTGSEIRKKVSQDLLNVLIPTVPNPITGFLLFVPRREVIFLDMSVEEAVKIIVSGGVLNPPDLLGQNAPVSPP